MMPAFGKRWFEWEERLPAEPSADFATTPETVAGRYRLLAGRDFSALPADVQQRFALIPPDFDQSDIDFALDPTAWCRDGAAPRRNFS